MGTGESAHGGRHGGCDRAGAEGSAGERDRKLGRAGCAAAEDGGGVAPRGARRHLQEKPAPPTELHAHVAQDVEEPEAEVPGG